MMMSAVERRTINREGGSSFAATISHIIDGYLCRVAELRVESLKGDAPQRGMPRIDASMHERHQAEPGCARVQRCGSIKGSSLLAHILLVVLNGTAIQ
jgi:hypothetical protein